MILTATQVAFLQRLIADRPDSRRYGQMAALFATDYGLGRISGRSILYGEPDWALAEKLLDNRGIPRERASEMRRADTAPYVGISEKSFGKRPHAGSVAVRAAFGSCPLDGEATQCPEGGYQVLLPEDAMRVQCQQLLVVENLETFRFLGRYRWIDYQRKPTLAIFRGDTLFNPAEASQVIADRIEPVLAFTDFDPAGLAIAERQPRLAGLILPAEDWLREATAKAKRGDLYESQIEQYASRLSAAAHPDLQRAYRLLREWRKGYNQEWMESAPGPTK